MEAVRALVGRQEDKEELEEGDGYFEPLPSMQLRLDDFLNSEESPRGAAGNAAHLTPPAVLDAEGGEAGEGTELTEARAFSWVAT